MASILKHPSGWRAHIRLANRPAVSKVFPSKAEAVRWAREQEAAPPDDLQESGPGKGKPHTIRSIIEEYTSKTAKIHASKLSCLTIITHYMGDVRLAELTTKHIMAYVQKRSTERFNPGRYGGRLHPPGPTTIKKELVYLGVALEHGGAFLDSKDASEARATLKRAVQTLDHAGLIAKSNRRDRRPTQAELSALVSWCHSRPAAQNVKRITGDIILFAVATAMRRGEIVGPGGITWEDYDAKARTVVIRGRKDPTVKGGRDMRVPLLKGPFKLNGEVIDPCEIIERQRKVENPKGRIFPFMGSTIANAFSAATKACGIEDLVFHDLRHEGISLLFEHGLNIPQVSAISGHKSWENLRRYTHITPESILTSV